MMLARKRYIVLSLAVVIITGLLMGFVVQQYLKENPKEENGNINNNNQNNSNQNNSNSNQTFTNFTAKEKYYLAKEKAEMWRSDAYLVRVSSDIITDNITEGKCSKWNYEFYSPSKKKNYDVSVTLTEVVCTEKGSSENLPEIADGWIDSPDALISADTFEPDEPGPDEFGSGNGSDFRRLYQNCAVKSVLDGWSGPIGWRLYYYRTANTTDISPCLIIIIDGYNATKIWGVTWQQPHVELSVNDSAGGWTVSVVQIGPEIDAHLINYTLLNNQNNMISSGTLSLIKNATGDITWKDKDVNEKLSQKDELFVSNASCQDGFTLRLEYEEFIIGEIGVKQTSLSPN